MKAVLKLEGDVYMFDITAIVALTWVIGVQSLEKGTGFL